MVEFKIYMVREDMFPTYLPGLSDRQKYDRLMEVMRKQGYIVSELRLRAAALFKALEAVDHEIGNTGFLPVFATNNSPGNVLGNDSDCPAFGYFDPQQTKDLYASLNELPDHVIKRLSEREGYLAEKVFQEFLKAAKQASEKDMSLAISHE